MLSNQTAGGFDQYFTDIDSGRTYKINKND